MPLILLFLFAIIDFGLALNAQNSDTNLANVTARSLTVMGASGSPPKVSCPGQSQATQSQATLLEYVDCMAAQDDETQPTYVCVLDASTANSYAANDALKVEVQAPFHWFGLVGTNSGATTTIGASATMRIEQALVSGTTPNTYVSGTQCPS